MRGVASGAAPLPAWLAEPEPAYEPPCDRDGFLRRNALSLASMLTVFRTPACPEGPVDRMLARVSPVLRLMGTIVCVGCVSAARNMAFVWVALAATLVVLASRPARRILSVARPALVVALLAALVNVPAVFLGSPSAPVRVLMKSFVTVTIVLGLSNTVQTERLFGALASLHVPSHVVLVCDLAIRDLALVGQVATSLNEALACRSIGHAADKSLGTAGVLGMTFVKASELARRQSDAMACRGFDGTFSVERERVITPAGIAYLVALACAVICFVYLEGAVA